MPRMRMRTLSKTVLAAKFWAAKIADFENVGTSAMFAKPRAGVAPVLTAAIGVSEHVATPTAINSVAMGRTRVRMSYTREGAALPAGKKKIDARSATTALRGLASGGG